ncbi:hypothetical protein KKC00_03500 [Patescibacteria group bacterium]|nr:hypothetical protein [Patescibacteria group bacterium]
MFEAVLNKAGLDDERAQRLIENGGDFQESLREALENHSATNQFADEEVASSYGYLSGYKPKGITEQTNILRQLFPGIGYANEKLAEQPIPEGAEGWFAIPRWQKVAKTYPEAVQIVLDLIKKTRGKLYNWREGQIDSQHIRQSAKTAKMFQALGEQQKDNDILVVPCQFGLRHRGRSVCRAIEVMGADEFGLDAFSIGIMILTHPERLQHYDDLWIDCAGDEFSDGGGSSFGQAPYFNFNDGRVKFDADTVDSASEYCGSASALLPQ